MGAIHMFVLAIFLVLGVHVAAFFSLWAGLKIFRRNKALAGFTMLGAVASVLANLWEFRYDIDLISNLIRDLWGYKGFQKADDLDLDRFALPLYISSALAVLLARFRWKPEYGSALVLNLALVFWVLAALPFLLLTPGMFAP